jgi:hypothetical protein
MAEEKVAKLIFPQYGLDVQRNEFIPMLWRKRTA